MKKHAISVINCLLSVFVFLCVFADACHPGKGSPDFEQQVNLCCYSAIFIVIAIYCICAKPYYSNTCLWVGAIFCMLLPVNLSCLWIRYGIFSLVTDMRPHYPDLVEWIYTIVPPIISGLYVYAALVKE